jgi:hypothetical protein
MRIGNTNQLNQINNKQLEVAPDTDLGKNDDKILNHYWNTEFWKNHDRWNGL